jgi:hypothetical protein
VPAQRRLVHDRVLHAGDAGKEPSLPIRQREVGAQDVVGGERRDLSLDHGDRGVQAVRAAGDAHAVDAAEDDLEAFLLVGEERHRLGARRVRRRVRVVLVVLRGRAARRTR